MSKITEAENYIKKAEKCMKTSFLKWSVDAEGALENYTKAAECYRDGKDIKNAIKMYTKVADMHSEANSLFYCAKALEDAANLYKSINDFKSMTETVLNAGNKLRINGSSDSACQLMKRSAKAIEDDEPAEAAKLYMYACDAAQDKDSVQDAGEFAGLAAKLFIRVNDIDNCMKALQQKANLLSVAGVFHESGRAVICQILIHLSNNDFIAASKAYETCIEQNSFGTSDDSSPVNQLLNAIDRQEFDEARRILRTPTFMYLDNDFVKLARNIKFPETVVRSTGDDKSESQQVEYVEDIN